MELKLKEVMLW